MLEIRRNCVRCGGELSACITSGYSKGVPTLFLNYTCITVNPINYDQCDYSSSLAITTESILNYKGK